MKWRHYVKQIAPYVPGKSIEEVKKEYHLDEVIRLASNESPLGPSPKACEAMRLAIMDSHLYPDSSTTSLREKLADRYSIRKEEIMTGNGADNVISLIISAYVNEGDEVLYCSPTFPAYRSAALLMGGKPVEVPLTDQWAFDLEGLEQQITEKTKLIFICNPNNPTGTIVDKEALEQFIENVPDHVLVVLDEAYIEYVQDKNYVTGIDLYKKDYPVITVRTFSKFYGLAGLRIGYAVASEDILQPILRLREPFAVNRIAIEGAIAALDDAPFTEKHLQLNEEGIRFLSNELTDLGFTVFPSYTNFLYVHLKLDAKKVFENLLEKGIIIRPCNPWGYDEYARITIGTQEQNEFFIKTLKDILLP